MRKRRPAPETNGTRPAAARIPPHNLEAEEAILGAAMLTRPALEVLATRVRPEDFYRPAHGHIAAALLRLYVEDVPVDPVTVAAALEHDGHLDGAGGRAGLLRLQAATPAAAHAAYYAAIVSDAAELRRVLGRASEVSEAIYTWRPPGPSGAVDPWPRVAELVAEVVGQAATSAADRIRFADIGAILDGGLRTTDPDLFVRSDGGRLLYAGRMHVLQGEPTSGKTFVALMAACQVLEAGGAAVYLDYEDTPVNTVARLLDLGTAPDGVRARFHYLRPDHLDAASKAALISEITKRNPDLVVIDGVAEAISQDGYDEDRASDVVAWLASLARPLAATGAAVVMLDHVVKSKEERGRWARGSGAKLGAIDGAAYYLAADPPFSRTTAGRVKLIVAKDRLGAVGPPRSTAALIHVEPQDGLPLSWRIEPSRFVDDDGKPTAGPPVTDELLETILAVLEKFTGEGAASRQLIRDQVHARNVKFREQALGEALARLENDGRLIAQKGPRGARLYELPPRQNTLDEVLP